MKTLEQVKAEVPDWYRVYDRADFAERFKDGWFTDYDGSGVYHDGENKTDVSVFVVKPTTKAAQKYPYVLWCAR